jgi:hypothetical protein
MSTLAFLPGDEVIVSGKIKSVGGNYVIVTFTELPTFETSELVLLKEHVVKLKPTTSVVVLKYQRFQEKSPEFLKVEKFASVSTVKKFDSNGVLESSKWLQDLDDSRVQVMENK